MSLEAIEEQILAYMEQISNPLVRIEVLLAHLRDRGLADSMNAAQLKDFLTRHDRVRVMEPAIAAPDSNDMAGAYVILKTRVPTPEQLTTMMLEQLQALEEALVAARLAAIEADDTARVAPIEEALRRIGALFKRLNPVDPPQN
jgi:hypothetical protein